MTHFSPGDIVTISKDHRGWGIRFLESEGMFNSKFSGSDRFLILEVFEERVKVVSIFGDGSLLTGTFYKSWVQKDPKFNQK